MPKPARERANSFQSGAEDGVWMPFRNWPASISGRPSAVNSSSGQACHKPYTSTCSKPYYEGDMVGSFAGAGGGASKPLSTIHRARSTSGLEAYGAFEGMDLSALDKAAPGTRLGRAGSSGGPGGPAGCGI